MELVTKLYEAARRYRACGFFTGKETLSELMAKFLTAKGAEFCIKYDFPSSDLCSELKAAGVAANSVYIDAGERQLYCPERIALVGDTEFTLECSSPDYPSRIILMKGARAHIIASGYSVVAVQAQDGCVYDITKRDHAFVSVT